MIVLDNISRPLEGESLNTLLTEETMSDRILGVSQNAVVPTNVLLLANGNNLGVKGDTHRRIIAARILAGEHPEQRTFKRPNLLAYVEANRPTLVAAGLTVLRAYEVAGRPSVGELTPFGSYEDWDTRVRRALIWLGEADPCMTRERFKANDPDREALAAMLHALHTAFAGRWFKAADVARNGDLYDTLTLAGISPNSRSIGTYLVARRDDRRRAKGCDDGRQARQGEDVPCSRGCHLGGLCEVRRVVLQPLYNSRPDSRVEIWSPAKHRLSPQVRCWLIRPSARIYGDKNPTVGRPAEILRGVLPGERATRVAAQEERDKTECLIFSWAHFFCRICLAENTVIKNSLRAQILFDSFYFSAA